MSDLTAARLERLHKQFLDASERFPHLHLLAVYPRDLPTWPLIPAYSDGDTLGLPVGTWRDVFRPLDLDSRCAFNPVTDRWLWMDGRMWQGAFYYKGPTIDESNLKSQFERVMRGVAEFENLGDVAASHFDVPPDPDFLSNSNHLMRAKGSDRWLEKLHALGLYETLDDGAFIAKRLKGDVYTASARAIELISEIRAASAPSDLMTTAQLARLADVEPKTFLNQLSRSRNADLGGSAELAPTVPSSGKRPAQFSYGVIRPWLLATWPSKSFRFPESFDEARQILTADI
jgi:hypothetical protein